MGDDILKYQLFIFAVFIMSKSKNASKEQPWRGKDNPRNPGIELDLGWVNEAQVNRPAVLRRAATHLTRRSIKKQSQLSWLLRALTCMDLTTLAGDDTSSNVTRLCMKAKKPLRDDIAAALGVQDMNITTGAVCVYPNRVKDCAKVLAGSGVPIASVATGFPAGQTPHHLKLEEIKIAVADGADEIDIVLSRDLVIQHKWQQVYDEVKDFRAACGKARMKTILATGDIPTFRDIYKVSLICMMAGADYIKTSTGKEGINATLPIGFVMARAIRDYYEKTGYKVGFKPAGGIRSAKDSVFWLSMMYEELGEEWTHPNLFRIGASSLLADIERQLEHGCFGTYSAHYYNPMS